MMKKLSFFLIFFAFAMQMVYGVAIEIRNASFEEYVLSDGNYTTPDFPWGGVRTTNPIPQWTVTGFAGTYNPTSSVYPGGVPDGSNVIYGHVQSGQVGDAIISQILTSNLQANTRYTLQVAVGHYGSFQGYKIQLLAGGNLLAQDNNTILPTVNTFSTSTTIYETGSSNAYLGQALEIRLISFGVQANFDHVRLNAETTVVPECSSFVLLCIFFLFFIAYRK
ncbi:MAG: hypothetical protein HUU50_17765 [Candidatus Brocadiae bacterium]|nr:hypothetical protein [Candidatus Brocadiia bacterium]